jgi:hypothetical protein
MYKSANVKKTSSTGGLRTKVSPRSRQIESQTRPRTEQWRQAIAAPIRRAWSVDGRLRSNG